MLADAFFFRTFGNITKFGYEERYTVSGLQLDVFASDTNRTQGEIWTAVWLRGFVYPCVMKIESYVWYNWWGQQVGLQGREKWYTWAIPEGSANPKKTKKKKIMWLWS